VLNRRFEALDGEYVVLSERAPRPRWRPRPRANIFEALQTQSRVIHALIIRETRTRFGDSKLGYGWALLEPMLHIRSRQSRNQTGKFGHIESSAVRVILDDPPIHIHPDIPAARGCKPNEPCGFTPFRLTHDSILGALPPVNFAHKLSRVSS
jgi:hypothetical protein